MLMTALARFTERLVASALLRQAEIVDGALNWTGGDTHLVSLGELIDRGPGSRIAHDLASLFSE